MFVYLPHALSLAMIVGAVWYTARVWFGTRKLSRRDDDDGPRIP